MAIARGTGKEELARKLGARHYIDSTAQDPAEALAIAHFGAGLDRLGPGARESTRQWIAKFERVTPR